MSKLESTNAKQFPRQISEVLLARLLAVQYPQPRQPPCRATSTTSQSQQRRAAAGAGGRILIFLDDRNEMGRRVGKVLM